MLRLRSDQGFSSVNQHPIQRWNLPEAVGDASEVFQMSRFVSKSSHRAHIDGRREFLQTRINSSLMRSLNVDITRISVNEQGSSTCFSIGRSGKSNGRMMVGKIAAKRKHGEMVRSTSSFSQIGVYKCDWKTSRPSLKLEYGMASMHASTRDSSYRINMCGDAKMKIGRFVSPIRPVAELVKVASSC